LDSSLSMVGTWLQEGWMRIGVSVSAMALSLMASVPAAFGGEGDLPGRLRMASEVRVEQAHGVMPAGSKPIEGGKSSTATPEGGVTNSAAAGSPNIPATCDQQNASSTACYSATQQTRPVTR
jgi:hypothetical protein